MGERRRGYNKLFKELGLDNDQPEESPFVVLGLDQDFAADLLREDPDGDTVKFAAQALFRVLSRRYHSDVQGTGDAERFRRINTAHDRIAAASVAALTRWTKTEKRTSVEQFKKAASERELLLDRASELLQTNIELGNDPQHFSQLPWAQGILLERARSTLLLRALASPDGGLHVLRGRAINDKLGIATTNSQAFDFQEFLRSHGSFDMEPGSRIVTFFDEQGRASILAPDLSFIMDITNPVAKYRTRRRRQSERERLDSGNVNAWADSPDPLLFITNIPSGKDQKPEAQIITFPPPTIRDASPNIPMEVVGTLGDPRFFTRVRNLRASSAIAITGSGKQITTAHFNVLATPTRHLIEHEADYSPLITHGNSLLLYDPSSNIPVVTDAKVIGMIGSHSWAT